MSARGLVVLAALVSVPAAHAAGTAHTVSIEGLKFVPERLEVKAGDSITWVNKDPVPHTVTAKAARVDSGDIAPGKRWKLVVKKKGEIDYLCRVHPMMHGAVVVK